MSKKTIVVIEDEVDIREVLIYNLEREGFLVFGEADGLRSLQLIQEKIPDLVLLDLPIQIPFAYSENLRGPASMAVHFAENSLDVPPFYLLQRGESVPSFGPSEGTRQFLRCYEISFR